MRNALGIAVHIALRIAVHIAPDIPRHILLQVTLHIAQRIVLCIALQITQRGSKCSAERIISRIDVRIGARHDGTVVGSAGRIATGARAGQRDRIEFVNELSPRRQVLLARAALRRQVGRDGLVRGLERGIEPLPQRTAGGTACPVEFLPSKAQLVDELGALPDRQLRQAGIDLTARDSGKRLGLQGQVVARPPAGPVLPALELRILRLDRSDTRTKAFGRRAALQ